MLLKFLNHFITKMMLYFRHLAINLKLKIQSFLYVDSYAKIFLILYPPLENSTTRIAILQANVIK